MSERRLAAGDISVYANRRLKLEAARYAALEAEANLVRRSARIALSALLAASADSIGVVSVVLTDSLPTAIPRVSTEQLLAAALRNRDDYQVASLELEALASMAKGLRVIRELVEEFTLKGGKRVVVLGDGRLVNLAAAEGHPSSVMDMSFANQAL